MLKDTITYLNTKVEAIGYFNTVLCLAEKIEREDRVYPATYIGGEYKEINLDPNGSICYWRKNGDASINEQENTSLVGKVEYKTTIPLKFIGFIKKEKATDDAYFSDNVISAIVGTLTTNNAALKSALKAKTVSITASKWVTNAKEVGSEEYSKIDFEARYTHAYFSIDFNLVFVTNQNCFTDICSDIPTTFPPITPGQTFCEKVDACLGISEDGDETFFLNQKGDFVQVTGGGSGQDIRYDFIAGENLGGQRLVVISGGEAFYFDPMDENNVGKQIGLTTGAATTGNLVTIILDGIVTGFGGTLIQDSVYYANTSGQLTTSIPISGIDMRVGVAIDTNILKLELSEPVVLI